MEGRKGSVADTSQLRLYSVISGKKGEVVEEFFYHLRILSIYICYIPTNGTIIINDEFERVCTKVVACCFLRQIQKSDEYLQLG